MDEGIWEGLKSGLVHHDRLTPDCVGLTYPAVLSPAPDCTRTQCTKTVAFVAASVIAPGYEPFVKTPLSMQC